MQWSEVFFPIENNIFYNYDKAMTKDIILNIIARLYDVGYTVIALVSDMSPGNMTL